MQRSARLLIVLGFILAIVSAGATLFILRRQPQGNVQPVETASVVVAFQNIEAHVPVPPDAIGVKEWPQDSVPPGAILNPADAVGKLTRSPIFPGQILLASMLIDKKVEETRLGLGSDASFIIPKGKIAVAMTIDNISGVAGAIQSGDRVDVLLSMRLQQDTAQGITQEPVTQLALQDIEVLRVGIWNVTGNRQQDQPQQVVTFLVDRQQALILKHLRENTLVDLALRAAGDHEVVTTETVSEDYMIREFDIRPR